MNIFPYRLANQKYKILDIKKIIWNLGLDCIERSKWNISHSYCHVEFCYFQFFIYHKYNKWQIFHIITLPHTIHIIKDIVKSSVCASKFQHHALKLLKCSLYFVYVCVLFTNWFDCHTFFSNKFYCQQTILPTLIVCDSICVGNLFFYCPSCWMTIFLHKESGSLHLLYTFWFCLSFMYFRQPVLV